MKLYLKIIAPIFIFALVYSFLAIFFGPRGFFAVQQLKRQRDSLIQHVQLLSDMSEKLNIRIANLSSDPQTIAVYAHDLGYVHKGEGLIKLMNFSGTTEYTDDAGVLYLIESPRFLPDAICKTIAISVGIIVILCEMIVSKKHAHSKEGY
ncbi:MAG: FtsB family cell division protein [Treponema sp.]|uniref:FtsB family cell division protein n=1 Tax=Treponema sp. TaxID=166 RepID=UPI003FA25F02